MSAEPSHELAVVEHGGLQYAYEPRNFVELKDACTTLFKSGLLPKACASPEAAVYIALRGRELGLSLGQSFASINIIDGKTVLSSDLIVSRVRKSSHCKVWRITEMTEQACAITAQRDDDTPVSIRWTIEMAQKAGLTNKDNWRKYPRSMLRNRCASELAKAVFPEEAQGMYDNDEADEIRRIDPMITRVVAANETSANVVEAVEVKPSLRKAGDVARELHQALTDARTLDELDAIRAKYKAMPFKPTMLEELEESYRQSYMTVSRFVEPA